MTRTSGHRTVNQSDALHALQWSGGAQPVLVLSGSLDRRVPQLCKCIEVKSDLLHPREPSRSLDLGPDEIVNPLLPSPPPHSLILCALQRDRIRRNWELPDCWVLSVAQRGHQPK
jgi:hypothetical protein